MTLRELLSDCRDEILVRFGERVRAATPERTENISVLLDEVPAFLGRVIEALASDRSDPSSPSCVSYALGFDVVAVVREWAILRDVILELMVERGHAIHVTDLRALSMHINRAAIAAIQEHVQTSNRERARLSAQHLGFLVHDFRHQLAGAVAAVVWMRTSPETALQAVATIDANLAELTEVLEHELALTRQGTSLSDGGAAFDRIALPELLAVVEVETRPLSAIRDVTLNIQSEPGLVLLGDFRLLRSALINVIGNAVKFTHRSTTVTVRACSRGDLAEISVTDACGGLASDAGFALSITRETIESHGGTMSVSVAQDEGCTYVVTIPLADVT